MPYYFGLHFSRLFRLKNNNCGYNGGNYSLIFRKRGIPGSNIRFFNIVENRLQEFICYKSGKFWGYI